MLSEIPIKIVKGIKIDRVISIKSSPFVIDCKNYIISLDRYLLRRSKK